MGVDPGRDELAFYPLIYWPIVAARPLSTTGELAQVVRKALGYRPGAPKDPATRSFQAIRIHVNAELDDLVAGLEAAGLTVLFDDRPKVSAGVKFGDVELIGLPTSVVVGRGLADGVVEVKDRATREARSVPVAEAVDAVVAEVRDGR